MLRTVQSLPQEWAFDTGLRPRPFPDEAASLLPGPLAATRTGLTPASDDELTTQDQPPTRSTSCLLGARKLLTAAIVFGGSELAYFIANLTKIVDGGWLPLLVAAIVVTVMTTWQRGRRIITARRIDVEGPLAAFIDQLITQDIPRVPGTAVFPHPTKLTAPLALRANVAFNHVLHEHVVIVSVVSENVPHIPPAQRLVLEQLSSEHDGILHLSARYGFQDEQNLPQALRQACGLAQQLNINPDTASYFLSRMTIERGTQPGMNTWRKRLFIGLSHNAASPATNFGLPVENTVIMGSRVEL